MIKFEEFLNEKLKISDYRKYAETITINPKSDQLLKKLFMMYPDHDKYYNRIYFPLNLENISLKPPYEMTSFLYNKFGDRYSFGVNSYRDGLIYDRHTNKYLKLGKFLQDNNKPDLLKMFETDPHRTSKKTKFYIVFSRHLYDLLGASTGRRWLSCRRIRGLEFSYLINDIEKGSIISYLIDENDKNINNPLSRIYYTLISRDGLYLLRPSSGLYGCLIMGFCNMCDELIVGMNKKLEELQK